jgi:hypothetical protein
MAETTTTEQIEDESSCETELKGGSEQNDGGGSEDSETEILDKMLKTMEGRVDAKDFRLTVAEYLRLVQVRKEIKEEQPTEVRVTWVEPTEDTFVIET